MFEDGPITPSSDEFTKEEVQEICKKIGGREKTLEFVCTNEGQLICGQFEIVMSFSQFDSIDTDCKFSGIFNTKLSNEFFEKNHRFKLNFLCIVMRPQNENLLMFEKDSRTGKLIWSFCLGTKTSEYMMLFFHKEKKHQIEYHIDINKDIPEVTNFTVMSIDERSIVPFNHELFDGPELDIHIN